VAARRRELAVLLVALVEGAAAPAASSPHRRGTARLLAYLALLAVSADTTAAADVTLTPLASACLGDTLEAASLDATAAAAAARLGAAVQRYTAAAATGPAAATAAPQRLSECLRMLHELARRRPATGLGSRNAAGCEVVASLRESDAPSIAAALHAAAHSQLREVLLQPGAGGGDGGYGTAPLVLSPRELLRTLRAATTVAAASAAGAGQRNAAAEPTAAAASPFTGSFTEGVAWDELVRTHVDQDSGALLARFHPQLAGDYLAAYVAHHGAGGGGGGRNVAHCLATSLLALCSRHFDEAIRALLANESAARTTQARMHPAAVLLGALLKRSGIVKVQHYPTPGGGGGADRQHFSCLVSASVPGSDEAWALPAATAAAAAAAGAVGYSDGGVARSYAATDLGPPLLLLLGAVAVYRRADVCRELLRLLVLPIDQAREHSFAAVCATIPGADVDARLSVLLGDGVTAVHAYHAVVDAVKGAADDAEAVAARSSVHAIGISGSGSGSSNGSAGGGLPTHTEWDVLGNAGHLLAGYTSLAAQACVKLLPMPAVAATSVQPTGGGDTGRR
jgi:hypothetical protein